MITKCVPYSWEISQPGGNDEGTAISKYSSLGAPVYSSINSMIWVFLDCKRHSPRFTENGFALSLNLTSSSKSLRQPSSGVKKSGKSAQSFSHAYCDFLSGLNVSNAVLTGREMASALYACITGADQGCDV